MQNCTAMWRPRIELLGFKLIPNNMVAANITATRHYQAMWAPLIARFMGPSWGPSGADKTQVDPMLAPWTLLSGTALEGKLCSHLLKCLRQCWVNSRWIGDFSQFSFLYIRVSVCTDIVTILNMPQIFPISRVWRTLLVHHWISYYATCT